VCDGRSVGVSPLLNAVEDAFSVALSSHGAVDKADRHVSARFFKSGGRLFSLVRKNLSRIVRACLTCLSPIYPKSRGERKLLSR